MRFSISKIKAFKACRRKYELRYVEGLVPIKKSDALETGSSYHKFLERLNNGTGLDESEGEFTKELAMAKAYEKYIYPKFKVSEAEKWFEKDLGNGDKLVGIVDAIAGDGHIVEHKTYGGNDSFEQYEYNLQMDEQILAYMLLTGSRKVWYTVCKKPTIRKRQSESDEDFYQRMVSWYDIDTNSKIRLFEITRTDDEVAEFEDSLMKMVKEMKNVGYYYRNPCHCTAWGKRCEYFPICLSYDPSQQYVEFEKKEEYRNEGQN